MPSVRESQRTVNARGLSDFCLVGSQQRASTQWTSLCLHLSTFPFRVISMADTSDISEEQEFMKRGFCVGGGWGGVSDHQQQPPPTPSPKISQTIRILLNISPQMFITEGRRCPRSRDWMSSFWWQVRSLFFAPVTKTEQGLE
ncbi:hypothetical protein BaRGS_00039729 [Batillaria attramentaria]|uniref:Uncharacterized protein n=1 Tax=Batillaria attramentaria TaxID=370345 RepID=A0ABD0J3A4_9CAEN